MCWPPGWFLAAVLAVVAITVKQPTNDSLAIPGTQSQQALNLLDQKYPGTGGAQVVFSVPAPKSLTDPAEHQAVEATLAQLRKLPQIVDVTDPYQTGTVSGDWRIAYAVVAYPVAEADVTPKAQAALLAQNQRLEALAQRAWVKEDAKTAAAGGREKGQGERAGGAGAGDRRGARGGRGGDPYAAGSPDRAPDSADGHPG